jgi:HAD superfamily hydrolase (TIGR01509 family)
MTAKPSSYELVIFDCDGVLVDSELISANVLIAALAANGIALSMEEFRQFFLGRKFGSAIADLKARTGQRVPETFQADYQRHLLDVFKQQLQPMDGVHRVLKAMKVAFCVASSSLPERLNCALTVCGLNGFFEGKTFSSDLVSKAKPAPDLFLYAAKAQGIKPHACLVIEDSEMGVRAAQAAGMDVWHYTGGSHCHSAHSLPKSLAVGYNVKDMTALQHLFFLHGLSHSDHLPFVREGQSHGA